MSNTTVRILSIMGLFLIVFAFGFWLSRTGKPHSSALLNVHKLIALGILLYLGLSIRRMHLANPLGVLEWTVFIVACLFFVAAIVTGGLVSVETQMPRLVQIAHKVLPWLTLISTTGMIYVVYGA